MCVDGKLRFASYYGDHMVLQKSPERAVLWGYGPEGAQVTVSLLGLFKRQASLVTVTNGKYSTLLTSLLIGNRSQTKWTWQQQVWWYLTFALELLLCNCCEGIQAVIVKFWINQLHLGKNLYRIDLVILLDRSSCIGLSLCVNPKTDWWPVQGGPCLWTYSSWLQPLLPWCVHKHWTLTFLPVAACDFLVM